MNPERKVYGRLTINDEQVSLGCASFKNIISRLVTLYARKRYEGEKLRIVVEIGDKKFEQGKSLLTRVQQLEAEMQEFFAPPDEEIFPGFTAQTIAEIMETPEYLAYEFLCDPEKRIGVPDSRVEEVRSAYMTRFPNAHLHFPLWRN